MMKNIFAFAGNFRLIRVTKMAFFTILKAVQSTFILAIISFSAVEHLKLSQNPGLIGESDTEFGCPFACYCEATIYYVKCVSDVHIKSLHYRYQHEVSSS